MNCRTMIGRMHWRSVLELAVVVFASVHPAAAQQAPAWKAVVTGRDLSTYSAFRGGVATEFVDTQGLPRTYLAPAESFGGLDANCPMPAGDPLGSGNPPWWTDPSGAADITGAIPLRPVAILNRSAKETQVSGIRFLGSFYDGSTTFGPGAALYEAVFFHNQKCYSAGNEYGFVRDPLYKEFFFYWSTNSNCGVAPSFCRRYRVGQPDTPVPNPAVLENDGNTGNTVPLPYLGPGTFLYEAYSFRDSADLKYKFRISIIDPKTSAVLFETIGTPDAWYPLEKVHGSDGYLTATMNKTDPGDTMRYADLPYLRVDGLSVGRSSGVGVVNSASGASISMAPGEMTTLYTHGAGPPQFIPGRIDSSGKLATELAGYRVLFDGTPAPIFSASPNQIAVLAPFEISGRGSTDISLTSGGAVAASTTSWVAPASPGIFTLGQSGKGAALAFHQDNTVNSPLNPAAKGSVIFFYATGAGQMLPSPPDGTISPLLPPFRTPQLPVTATIGGTPARVIYAGSAPGYVEGLLQVNVEIPPDAPTGAAVPLIVMAGDAWSAPGVTVSVR
jgi:uncharacterized protein (TIGR03437 family)